MDKLPVCQQVTFVSNQMRRPDSGPGGIALDIARALLQCPQDASCQGPAHRRAGPSPCRGADGPGGAGLRPEMPLQSTICVLPGALHCCGHNPAGATAVPLPHLGALPSRALGGTPFLKAQENPSRPLSVLLGVGGRGGAGSGSCFWRRVASRPL